MSSIFIGKTGLRSQYEDLTFAEIQATTGPADAALLITFNNVGRLTFLDSSLNVDIGLLLVHPDADSTLPQYRLPWMEFTAGRVVNFDLANATSLQFDVGTKIYAYKLTGTATSGKMRVFVWG